MARTIALPILALASALTFASGAQAMELYGKLSGGDFHDSFALNQELAGGGFETNLFPDFLLRGAAGLDFGYLRLEGEALIHHSEPEELPLGGHAHPAGGELYSYGGMANAYVDIPTGLGITPYVGGGIGYAEVLAQDLAVTGTALAEDKDVGLAYQFKAGVAFSVTPQSEITIGYRFFGTEDLDMIGLSGGEVAVEGLRTHIAEIGLRINF